MQAQCQSGHHYSKPAQQQKDCGPGGPAAGMAGVTALPGYPHKIRVKQVTVTVMVHLFQSRKWEEPGIMNPPESPRALTKLRAGVIFQRLVDAKINSPWPWPWPWSRISSLPRLWEAQRFAAWRFEMICVRVIIIEAGYISVPKIFADHWVTAVCFKFNESSLELRDRDRDRDLRDDSNVSVDNVPPENIAFFGL